MTIWVDADSLARQIRSFIEKSAQREKVRYIFVFSVEAPVGLKEDLQDKPHVECDNADELLLEKVKKSDMVITRDIPLALRLMEECKAVVLSPEGYVHEKRQLERLKKRRDLNVIWNSLIPGSNRHTGSEQKKKEYQEFCRHFEKELYRLKKNLF